LELVKPASVISNLNFPILQPPPKRHTILFGRNTLEESVRTFESAEFVFVKVTSKFLHKLDRVDMDKSSLLRRRILEKFALSRL
jgi:hypothetical protein